MNLNGTILIVEDCEEAVPPLEIALQSHFGAPVRHSLDAEGALEILAESAYMLLAVITDLNLPCKTGFELIEGIRGSDTGALLPLIVVSANGESQARERALQLGADAFFVKPCSPAAICQSLERILHEKQLLATSDCTAPTPSSSDAE